MASFKSSLQRCMISTINSYHYKPTSWPSPLGCRQLWVECRHSISSALGDNNLVSAVILLLCSLSLSLILSSIREAAEFLTGEYLGE